MDFKDSEGNLHKGEDVIFPILTKDKNGNFEFLATGFFISASGDFVTAKHVVFDKNNIPFNPLYIVQSNKGQHVIRYVEFIFPHPTADIVYGKVNNIILYKGNRVPFKSQEIPFQLSNRILEIDETIQTFAFPFSKIIKTEESEIGRFQGDWFTGRVTDYLPNGRDIIFLPDTCYQTTIKILGGASGGPVIDANTIVVGVNSTGYAFCEEEEDLSFITPISKILEIVPIINGIEDTIENHIRFGRLLIRI